MENKTIPLDLEEAEVIKLRKSLNETDILLLGEEEKQQNHRQQIIFERTGEEEKIKIDYLDIQVENILSDKDKKTLWDEYKHYIDELIFTGLQDAIICRYIQYTRLLK